MSSSKLKDDPASRALALVIRYTRAGARSRREVLAHLSRSGVPERVAARVTSEAGARGLVDDRACARLWAEHWARQGYAWSAIRLKLSAKGLEGRAIDAAASGLGAASDDDRARLVVERLARRSAGRMSQRRVANVLASRGFDAELIEHLLAQAPSPAPSDAER